MFVLSLKKENILFANILSIFKYKVDEADVNSVSQLFSFSQSRHVYKSRHCYLLYDKMLWNYLPQVH